MIQRNFFSLEKHLSGAGRSGDPKLLDEKTPYSRFAKIARVLVRFDHIASFIVNANHRIM
jgi:hypothetical protein